MWRNLLKSDANVDLVHFTILRPPEKSSDGTPINELSLIAFPVADLFGRKIRDFDLISSTAIRARASCPRSISTTSSPMSGRAARCHGGGTRITPPREGLAFSPIGEIAPARPDGEVAIGAFRPVISPDGREASGDPRARRRRGPSARLGAVVPRDRRRGRPAAST